MKINENIKDDRIRKMLLVLKNMTVFFAGIIFLQYLPDYMNAMNIKYTELSVYSILFVIFVITCIYIINKLINSFIIKSSYSKILIFIELLFYLLIISLPIYISHSVQNESKYIFILLIVAAVIQYGLNYGILTAVTSAFLILLTDLINFPAINGINTYFQRDLVVSGIFIFIAWILGYYVELENENKKKNEQRLNILNTELQEHNIQRNHIQESLLKNKVCYDILFENSQNAVIVHISNKIIYANVSAAKLFGYEDPAELNEKVIYDYCAGNSIKSVKEKYLNISTNKLSKIIEEETIKDCKGHNIEVRNNSSFFIYEGQPSILTFLLDITSEKQIETLKNDMADSLKLLNETREFNSLITEFFINISHEIKTPINVIYVALQTMGLYMENYSTENVNKCKSYLRTMKQNCFRMIRLVNNLLDITRFDSGFIKLNRKNNNIVSIVEDIAQSVAVYLKSKNIELIFDTNVEEKIMAFDEDKVERIMLNLLSNAFKYSHNKGKISVSIEDRGLTVLIKVADEGEGIPKDKLDVIFERFGQANRSLSRASEGSGIGLYLVKSFVDMHGGKITVNSTIGIGTEFSIELPSELIDSEDSTPINTFETNVERINIEFSDIYTLEADK